MCTTIGLCIVYLQGEKKWLTIEKCTSHYGAAASDAVDELENIPLAMSCRNYLKEALLKAEEIYIETTIRVSEQDEE